MRAAALTVALTLVVSACSADRATPDDGAPSPVAAAERIVDGLRRGALDPSALSELAEVGGPADAWLVADVLRFLQGGPEQEALVEAIAQLTGDEEILVAGGSDGSWTGVTNRLIAADHPPPDDYRRLKGEIFTIVDSRWAPIFDDADAEIDWRWLSWGGVLVDDRPLGDDATCPRGCIPALDDPELVPAAAGDWYPDERIVFGIVEGGQAVALPKNVMEVHEMVNLTIGGRRIGVPYCTLCGSAQAYRTDGVTGATGDLVLRTSGLLSRSNKVMYDLGTGSVFDTFTGAAVTGPLQDADVVLEPLTVEVATWGAWRAAHPDTLIVAEDGGIGRTYPLDPLGDRDANGPIFPIGDVDDRLGVQAAVLGVIAEDGTPVAFDAAGARAALARGAEVAAGGVVLESDGGGLRARSTASGRELPAHEARWFAWSQFRPGTVLWTG
ncbi:MAG: DUF3179 domain-containing protein [Ilumatobacteraceae bacterium]|nr:DUF3179 domain-containing protein [Ilumatobacteraceae bacterium]